VTRRGATRPARTPKADADAELVALVGGRWDGQWFHRADWAAEKAAAEWSVATHGRPRRECAALGYRETRELVEHPSPREWPAGGRVWRWSLPADE
jgi:hypothetical protein